MFKKNIRNYATNLHYVLLILGIFILILALFENYLLDTEKLKKDKLSKYFLGVFILFSFFLINIFQKNFKQLINISLIVTTIFIFLFETYLLLKFTYIDKLTHESVGDYLIKHKHNKEIFPSISPMMYAKNYLSSKELSLGGVPNAKTIVCNENGYFFEFLSDQYGLNNDEKNWIQNNDYIIVGDSFAFGSCVKPQYSISGILENNFHKKNVNIAYRSNGPVIELLSLKFFVNKVNAKAILWFFYEGNDFNDLIEELSVQKIRNLYTNYDEKMIFTNEVNKNLINLYEDSFNKYISNNINNGQFNSLKKFLSLTMIRNFLKYNLGFNLYTNRFYKNNFLKDSKNKNELNKIFKEVKEISNLNDIDLHIIYIPAIENLLNKENKIYTEEKKILFSILDNLNINIIDTSQIFYLEENPKNLLSKYKIPGHFNPYGYKLLVSFVEEKISSQ